MMEDKDGNATYIPVSSFFQNRSVFITGGTGFMGKVLVEKLLRSCIGIKNIYLLIRSKRGQDVNSRLTELISSPLFEKIRNERPLDLQKIIPISGDITKPELGISQVDQKQLINSVSIVFHSAATVKFDEELKLSVAINIVGTKRLLHFCKQMPNLQALVHVSTAYSNCNLSEVREEIYDSPCDPENIIETMKWMDDDLVNELTPRLIGDRPNTYTFTKALAEQLLVNERESVPVVIVRPSIVISSINEPVPGWVDNWNGPTGIVSAAAQGFFRTMWCRKDNIADLVPVDIVINLMICAAWKIAVVKPENVIVYNCSTGMQNPITWDKFVDCCFTHLRTYPMKDLLWYPVGTLTSSYFLNYIYCIFYHTLPAYAIDIFNLMVGKKPFMVRIHNKLTKASASLQYFSTNEWRFVNNNVRALINDLSVEDRQMFLFDVSTINWEKYLESYILGIRQFIFKEPPSSLPEARKQLARLLWANRICKFLSIIGAWRALMMYSPAMRTTWFFFLKLVLRILCIFSFP